MKNITLAALFTLSALLFSAGAGFQLSAGNRSVTPLSCVSRHTLIHGSFSLTARYFFSFYNNRGVVRVNGAALRDGKLYPVSRQIFFNYTRVGDEYTLHSTYIEKLSADKGEQSSAEQHLPSFFSYRDRQFNFTLHQDRFRNAIIIFTEMPVFYCARRSLPLKG
ncbi:hypothetical protein SGI62_004472 [Enterobacter hormaechei]|uniref:hypothetical protein n=1 Tax=Enterobacter hormaechei TaxID=158836 RepID=UPI0013D114E7|nr:hypothetical protein [Enterobacter hormaechei]ELV3390545.1 hypothetical protein [Enterobacter hormaechei]